MISLSQAVPLYAVTRLDYHVHLMIVVAWHGGAPVVVPLGKRLDLADASGRLIPPSDSVWYHASLDEARSAYMAENERARAEFQHLLDQGYTEADIRRDAEPDQVIPVGGVTEKSARQLINEGQARLGERTGNRR